MLVSSCTRACMPACFPPSACTCTAGCADLMTLDTMTPQERKRQGYIHELIRTEETYVEDLELVLEVRTHPNMEDLVLLQRFKMSARLH